MDWQKSTDMTPTQQAEAARIQAALQKPTAGAEWPEHCGDPMAGVELPSVYDGISAYECVLCGDWIHRWPPGHPRRLATAKRMTARAEPL